MGLNKLKIIKFERQFESAIVIGDLHGNLSYVKYQVNQLKIKNTLLIVAGDVGLGFNGADYLNLNELNFHMKKNNNILLLLRGNHDNPATWSRHPDLTPFWQDGYENVRLLEDYTVLEFEDSYSKKRIYCQGGAYSIDRRVRMQGRDYWSDEPFVYDEEPIKDLEGITHIITHSAPDFCQPVSKSNIMGWLKNDLNLNDDLNRERGDHTKLYNKIAEKNKIQGYFYGHFHYSNQEYINGTLFKLCNISEFYEIK